MEFRYLKKIGLDVAAVEAPLDQPAAGASRWSPDMLKEQLEKLPATRKWRIQQCFAHFEQKILWKSLVLAAQQVSQLFPELCVEIMEVLHRWHRRLPLRVWSRMVKICKGSAHQVPQVLKEIFIDFHRFESILKPFR